MHSFSVFKYYNSQVFVFFLYQSPEPYSSIWLFFGTEREIHNLLNPFIFDAGSIGSGFCVPEVFSCIHTLIVSLFVLLDTILHEGQTGNAPDVFAIVCLKEKLEASLAEQGDDRPLISESLEPEMADWEW